MKRLLLVVGCLLFVLTSFATHISGGELYYTYQGPGSANNTDKYLVTMRLFRICGPAGANFASLDGENVTIGIYDNPGLTLVDTKTLVQQFTGTPPSISNSPAGNPCLIPFIDVCYQIGTYQATIELPRTANGYTLAWIRYTRTDLTNVSNSSSQMGATFTTKIPGTNQLPIGNNSCPTFVARDTNVVCKGNPFTLDFGAQDPDGDSLSYKYSPAYDGQDGPTPTPVPPPPGILQPISLIYAAGFSATNPFGTNAPIDVNTGLITGIAPANTGKYVVCVTVEEWRNGILINEHRKDFILRVENCSTPKPDLGLDNRTCDGFNFTFSDSTQNAFIAYQWAFGDGGTSVLPQPSHTYTDTGKYLIKLKVTAQGGCQDSATKHVYVFPGFIPNFTVVGSCYLNPYQFTSTTFTAYGFVDSTKWNFGDPNTLADTSNLPNPSYLYPSASNYTIRLYTTNSKGCQKDTLMSLAVLDKPHIQLPFKDTLICSIDTLQLHSNANGGSYSWTPNTSNIILNPNSSDPFVFPKDTTTFIVTVTNNGCINKDSIIVNVLDFITVYAGADTGICKTDTIRLHPVSYALSYLWTSSTGVTVDPVKYPLVQPLVDTKYYVTANLGKCQDKDTVSIKVTPYPQVSIANVGNLCYGKSVQLNATIVGSTFSWTPTTNMLFSTTLTPAVSPLSTTDYILMVSDTIGCPKPSRDTVRVTVIPPVTVFAGNDTAVVQNQPLLMNATTNADSLSQNTSYLWIPSTWLNNSTLASPMATINTTADSIKYRVIVTTADGCTGEDDIVVKIFKTEPDIFVPSAFTPNHDGKNDIFKPITVGISKLEYFRVFNRWGQVVFQTSEFDKGWDGKVGGIDQDSGTYVFMAQGTDYTGKAVFRKGTVVLIR